MSPSDPSDGSAGAESGSRSIAKLAERVASDLPNLSTEAIRELVGSVLVDLWRLLQEPVEAQRVLRDPVSRDAWVESRVVSALRLLRFGERRVYRQREVSPTGDLDRFGSDTDVASQATAELVFAEVVGGLSEDERDVLAALLESSSTLVDDAFLAARLGLAPSTFSDRKRRLLDRFREAFAS